MAITRDKKQTLVAELSDVLASAKMTVFAQYQGLSVADIQELRRAAREARPIPVRPESRHAGVAHP